MFRNIFNLAGKIISLVLLGYSAYYGVWLDEYARATYLLVLGWMCREDL